MEDEERPIKAMIDQQTSQFEDICTTAIGNYTAMGCQINDLLMENYELKAQILKAQTEAVSHIDAAWNLMVRVDFFKPSGKWYCTEDVKWVNYTNTINECFLESLKVHLFSNGETRLCGMFAVCIEPPDENSYPVSCVVPMFA